MEFIQEDFNAKFGEFRSVARLTGIYSDDISELFATFVQGQTAGSAALTYLRSDKSPRAFRLSSAQMDAFCEGWQTFKQRIIEANEAEEQRKAGVLEEARVIVRNSRTIIEELRIVVRKPDESSGAFEVSVPAIGWKPDYYAFGPDQLMKQVTGAIEAIESHMLWLEDQVLSIEADSDHPQAAHNREMVAAWRAIRPRSSKTNESALPELEADR